jgi:uncharacterized membrane protein YheB (UPF0754 family)
MGNQKSTRTYDSTVARMAGNIAGNIMGHLLTVEGIQQNAPAEVTRSVAVSSVAIARAIVAEVQRTEPDRQDT